MSIVLVIAVTALFTRQLSRPINLNQSYEPATPTTKASAILPQHTPNSTVVSREVQLIIGLIRVGGYVDTFNRLDSLNYSVKLLPADAGLADFRKYDVVYLPTGWAAWNAPYPDIEKNAPQYHQYVHEGGSLVVEQPNPNGQPDESVSPALLPYPITFYNLYDSDDWPPIIVDQQHPITQGLEREDMPGPADQIKQIDAAYEVLVRGLATNSPSIATARYGQGRIVILTDNSSRDAEHPFSDIVIRRIIDWTQERQD